MKKFTSGFFAGSVFTLATLAGIAFGVKKTIIEPLEEKENMIDESRRKAMRKSFAR